MKTVGFLLMGLVFALVVAYYFLAGRDLMPPVIYDSYADAASAGVIGKGVWLPSELPKSAKKIREAHDIDTNEVWFTYRDELHQIPESCKRTMWNKAIEPRLRKEKEPRDFLLQVRMLSRSKNVRIYSCRGEEYAYHLAFDPYENLGVGWSKVDQ